MKKLCYLSLLFIAIPVLAVLADVTFSRWDGVDWLRSTYSLYTCQRKAESFIKVGDSVSKVRELLNFDENRRGGGEGYTPGFMGNGSPRAGARVDVILGRRTFRLIPSYFCHAGIDFSPEGFVSRVTIASGGTDSEFALF